MNIYENNCNIKSKDLHYLKILSKQYPTISAASTEIINLSAILNLPKGTEHFISDIHGEYESFTHILKNASGVIRRKIDELFGTTLMENEKKSLATLIYYPEEKLEIIKKNEPDINNWYRVTLYRLIEICRMVSSKYTRSKVRKALPKDFSYIIEELLNEQADVPNKEQYYNGIINTIISIDRADEFIAAISKVIQALAVDRLHIVGDIYDRGPGAHIIMDELMNYHSIDIQWGNHDILWMGAAAGSKACIANAIRISTRYGSIDSIENGYGINLLPLATFAIEFYGGDPCTSFKPVNIPPGRSKERDITLLSKVHKAIAIIQFKLEGEIIKNHPEFNMDDRLVLNNIDYKKGTINLYGNAYKLNDNNFPTIDPENPYTLTAEEKDVMEKITASFLNSEKLQRHVRFLYSKGSIYLKFNSNLLFHGCIPLEEDGSFTEVNLCGKKLSGKKLLDRFDCLAWDGYFSTDPAKKQYGMDMLWYIWTGPLSPLFGKNRMTTFERYFIDDKKSHKETPNPYFRYRDDPSVCDTILEEFGLDPKKSHIINGHMPVKIKDGESPVKAGGKLIAIDGGFCKAYQPETGIAGYTLIYNSYGLLLSTHEPFKSTRDAIEKDADIITSTTILETLAVRKRVADTDIGAEIKLTISDLQRLLDAYRRGYKWHSYEL